MNKVHPLHKQNGDLGGHVFYCPGCKSSHVFDLRWTFNGSLEKPNFTPSLLVNGTEPRHPTLPRCHSFVTDGMIQFLGDCEHELAGQTVEIPDWNDQY